MLENEYYIANLIAGRLRGGLGTDQEAELNSWLAESADNLDFYNALINEEQFRSDLTQFRNADRNAVWQKTQAKIKSEPDVKVPVRKLWQRWVRLKVAAAVMILAGTGFYFYYIKTTSNVNVPVNDIAPGKNAAVLTLADGRKISLNEAANGRLASQAGVMISKRTDGQLVYKQEARGHPGYAEKSGNDAAYNSIETPKGGQYQVTLPDGSRVWLNSASSIRFPATFSNLKSRNIQLKGEAYFEVTRMREPFTVTTQKQIVKVLGTHFNINSYEDEQYLKTVLLEGSVSVSATQIKGGAAVVLKPGQQSNLGNGVLNVTKADIEKTMAWKNGYFSFNDENIQSIMRELSRWYDVEVRYEGPIPMEGFYAKISRSDNISRVLNALQSTKAIHFKLEGRRVIVTE